MGELPDSGVCPGQSKRGCDHADRPRKVLSVEQIKTPSSHYWIENLGQAIRHGARMLRKNPGFTAVAVLTLALGIGANTVVFSVARTVLLRPLGFDGEDRLMWIQRVNTQTGASENQLSWQDLEDIRSSTQSFESVEIG